MPSWGDRRRYSIWVNTLGWLSNLMTVLGGQVHLNRYRLCPVQWWTIRFQLFSSRKTPLSYVTCTTSAPQLDIISMWIVGSFGSHIFLFFCHFLNESALDTPPIWFAAHPRGITLTLPCQFHLTATKYQPKNKKTAKGSVRGTRQEQRGIPRLWRRRRLPRGVIILLRCRGACRSEGG